jgi:hypothetical protein
MCDKCRCEKEYKLDTDTFKMRVLPFFAGSDGLCLTVDCPAAIQSREYLVLAKLVEGKGLVGVDLNEDQREWLEENFEFKFNPITDEIMFS